MDLWPTPVVGPPSMPSSHRSTPMEPARQRRRLRAVRRSSSAERRRPGPLRRRWCRSRARSRTRPDSRRKALDARGHRRDAPISGTRPSKCQLQNGASLDDSSRLSGPQMVVETETMQSQFGKKKQKLTAVCDPEFSLDRLAPGGTPETRSARVEVFGRRLRLFADVATRPRAPARAFATARPRAHAFAAPTRPRRRAPSADRTRTEPSPKGDS